MGKHAFNTSCFVLVQVEMNSIRKDKRPKYICCMIRKIVVDENRRNVVDEKSSQTNAQLDDESETAIPQEKLYEIFEDCDVDGSDAMDCFLNPFEDGCLDGLMSNIV